MTEKEFLIEYAKELEGWMGVEITQGGNLEAFDDLTSLFLERHHKTYCEVEFVTKEDEMKFYQEMEKGYCRGEDHEC